MAWEVERIQTSDEKEIPRGTKVQLSLASSPGHVHVKLQLPGQVDFSDLGDLPIINRVVELPMKLVFLCHAHEDKTVVESISERLWQDGFLTWLDKRDLLPGDDWKTVIENAIERANYVLVFLSRTSVFKTGYVQREIKYAFEQRDMRPYGYRYIIPVLIEPCKPPKPFQDIQWLELWQEGAYEKLKQAMKEGVKTHREIEAKRTTEEQGGQWESLFSAWVNRENDNAMREMKSAGFTEGFFKFVLRVPYGIDQIDNNTLLEIARKSECHNTGWPIGVVLTKPEYRPTSLTDGIRAVIKAVRSIVSNVAEFDYWAMNNRGHFFFIRSQEEDATYPQELAQGKKFLAFDVAIWRISEIISYTSNLCTELNLKRNDNIKLSLSYEGLKGRVLSASSPLRRLSIAGKCAEDKYEKDLELQVADIMPKLKDHVYQIAIGLFGLFDFFKPDRPVVDSIVDEFLNARK